MNWPAASINQFQDAKFTKERDTFKNVKKIIFDLSQRLKKHGAFSA